jgi:hypothetical protein
MLMKQHSLILVVILLVVLAFACTTPMPQIPRNPSPQEVECVSQCQTEHTACKFGCRELTESELTLCMQECDRKLYVCHQLCFEPKEPNTASSGESETK